MALLHIKQVFKRRKAAPLQCLEHLRHGFAHAQLFARDAVVLHQTGTLRNVGPGLLQVQRCDLGQRQRQGVADGHTWHPEVAPLLRQLRQLRCGVLHLLVFQQAAHQFGTRVAGFFAVQRLARWQQHARLDLYQHRRHQQILCRQFQVAAAHLVHIRQVLARECGHRDVKDVEVLLADQIQQQVQRPLKGLQNHLQRVWRDVQVSRQCKQRLAIQAGQRHGGSGRAGSIGGRPRACVKVQGMAHTCSSNDS